MNNVNCHLFTTCKYSKTFFTHIILDQKMSISFNKQWFLRWSEIQKTLHNNPSGLLCNGYSCD